MTTTTAILLRHLQVKSKSGFEWLCLCPYHEDKTPSFSINIRKKLFVCYACGAKGNMAQLLQHLGVSEGSVQEEVSLDELTEKIRSVGEDVSRTARPTIDIPIPATAYSDKSAISNYWNEERMLDDSAIQAYKLGYDMLNDEAIIPVRDFNGHNVGVIRRTFDPSRPRYLYSKGMKKSEVVFGAYEAMRLAESNKGLKGILVVTEGSVDAMTVYNMKEGRKHFYVGVALLGANMSKQQAQIIKKMGFEEIVVATDMDRFGRLAQIQATTALKSVRAGSFITAAEWEVGKGKDLNSLPKDILANALKASRIDVYEKLIKQHTPVVFMSTPTKSTTTTTSTQTTYVRKPFP